ncbi:MAG TPA: ABC transporter ATP-binding protein [Micromonosporaceae bacterium]
MLKLEQVSAGYRRLRILHEIDLEVRAGEIVALIGANGAGKTTTLRAISGLIGINDGRITFDGQRIDGRRPDRIVRRGLVHVPQDRALFGRLSVGENLQMGAYTRDRAELADSLARVHDLFPVLADRRDQRADTLSGGQQQMLAIGRALMARPRLLTLDEPSIGLAPNLVAQVLTAVTRIRDTGVTVLIVEQNAAHTLKISDRAYVLESGAIAVEGSGAELVDDERVKTAYLGM